MKITKKLIKYNTSSRKGTSIKYIVIHDTGNQRRGAGANNHYLYFNGGNRNASAHYFVDDKEILQLVEDTDASWHCGDGKGKNGITNSNSIGIEICVNPDSDYDVAVQNTIELVKQLMITYNIPLERVVRHFDASGKSCPRSMMANNWKAWNEFKLALSDNSIKVKVKIKGIVIYLDGFMVDDINYVSIRQIAETLGHSVDWDNDNKVVVIK